MLVTIIGIISLYINIYIFDDPSFEDNILGIIDELKIKCNIDLLISFMKAIIPIISLVSGIFVIILMFVVLLLSAYNIYEGQLSYSVKVSEKNFPEIYKKVKEYTYLLGLEKEPEVYIQQTDGMLNAYTSWIPGRSFIQLNAELVDIAYMENKDFDTVYFVMAHEFGHIYLHHIQLQYIIWSSLVSFFPLLGVFVFMPLLSRAREYSADRVAQALTNKKNQIECMMLLSVGRHAYTKVNIYDYINNMLNPKGLIVRLFRWVLNLISTHPIMPFRVMAILNKIKKSGRLL